MFLSLEDEFYGRENGASRVRKWKGMEWEGEGEKRKRETEVGFVIMIYM